MKCCVLYIMTFINEKFIKDLLRNVCKSVMVAGILLGKLIGTYS